MAPLPVYSLETFWAAADLAEELAEWQTFFQLEIQVHKTQFTFRVARHLDRACRDGRTNRRADRNCAAPVACGRAELRSMPIHITTDPVATEQASVVGLIHEPGGQITG